MRLAERLHKTLAEIYQLSSEEIGLWIALAQIDAQDRHLENMIARANANLARKRMA